jgi:hypothetical protein
MPKFKTASRKMLKFNDVFDNEKDFSDELPKKYLKQIEEIINESLDNPRREVRAGKYSIDILCDIKSSDEKELLIIENQKGFSDHTHLGQCITYASGKKAKIVVWICEDFEEEHITAIEWLNKYFGENVNFYGIKVEIYDTSPNEKTINFIPIVKPNDQVFIEGGASKPHHSSRKKFYTTTLEKYNKISNKPAKGKPSIKSNVMVFSGECVLVKMKHLRSEKIIKAELKIWPDVNYAEKWSEETFDIIEKNKEKIQNELGNIKWISPNELREGSKRRWGFEIDVIMSDDLENIDEHETDQVSEKVANIMKKMVDLIEDLKLE